MTTIRIKAAALAVAITQLSLTAWVGGAILFVITSIAEQRSHSFDSIIRDQLATIRFPLYYLFGAVCLSTALVMSGLGILLSCGRIRRRLLAAWLLTLLSGVVAVADYKCVFQPLQHLIVPPGRPRTEAFTALHEQSRLINEVHLGLAILAAVVISIPEPAKADGFRKNGRSCGSLNG